MNKAEREHIGRVKSLPCSVCSAPPPSDAHHCKGYEFGSTMRNKSSHYDTIPLCRAHHISGGHGVAFHAGRRTWEQNFGTQREHLEKTRQRLIDFSG